MIIKINLPENVKLLVKENDYIDFGQPLAEKKETKEIIINLFEKLNVRSNKIFNCLKKFVGDQIKKNDLLASKKGLFYEKKIFSPVDGQIKRIDHNNGEVVIKTESNKNKKILAFFKGRIHKISDQTINLEIKKSLSLPIKKNNFPNFGGQVLYFDEKNDEKNIEEEKIENKVIVSQFLQPTIAAKLQALGSIGFVLFKKPEENFDLPIIIVKKADDIKKVKEEGFSYCLVQHLSDTIIFYQPIN